MGAIQTRLSNKQLLLQEYRDSYRRFAREADKLRMIQAQSIYNAAETENALSRVEEARLSYNDSRDRLAACLMSSDAQRAFGAIAPATRQEIRRVKGMAELFWELAGKPQGTADDDWYRAERVVRHVKSEVCCAR